MGCLVLFLVGGCPIRLPTQAVVTMRVSDSETGTPVSDVQVRFAVSADSPDLIPDQYLDENGEPIGATNELGEFSVTVDAETRGVPFTVGSVHVLLPVWIVELSKGGVSNVVIVRPNSIMNLPEGELPNIFDYAGGVGEDFAIMVVGQAANPSG